MGFTCLNGWGEKDLNKKNILCCVKKCRNYMKFKFQLLLSFVEAHLFMYCPWLFSHGKVKLIVVPEDYGLDSSNICYLALSKKCADSWMRFLAFICARHCSKSLSYICVICFSQNPVR